MTSQTFPHPARFVRILVSARKTIFMFVLAYGLALLVSASARAHAFSGL